MKGPKFQS